MLFSRTWRQHALLSLYEPACFSLAHDAIKLLWRQHALLSPYDSNMLFTRYMTRACSSLALWLYHAFLSLYDASILFSRLMMPAFSFVLWRQHTLLSFMTRAYSSLALWRHHAILKNMKPACSSLAYGDCIVYSNVSQASS